MRRDEFTAYKIAYDLYARGYIREDQIEEYVRVKLKEYEEEQKPS